MSANEQTVAEGIVSGALPSPTEFYNAFYWAIRISGTGCVWRGDPVNEFAWRDPSIRLSDAMVDRVAGLPVVANHKSLLVEGDPCLLDHIAICEKGRWTRDGPPVENTEEINVNYDSAYDYT